MDAVEWLEALRSRYDDVEFEEHVVDGARVPHELFDTVAENLLENARYKRSTARDITIRVYLLAGHDRAALRICDSGENVPPEVADDLFGNAVSSGQGLGVGLYQSARLAAHLGYDLRLERNEPGSVCFLLEGPAAAADTPAADAGGAPAPTA